MNLQRAYSILNVKAIDEDEEAYYIQGVATTPTPDRYGDVVEPLGAKFALPMPLLWQHNAHAPVGRVEFAKPQKNGIPYKAILPKVKETGALKDRIEEAVQSIKYRLVSAVSIGFRAMNGAVEYLESGGIRFKEWEWLELSLVTIPANAEATIKSVQSIDRGLRAASGREATPVVRLKSTAGVSANDRTTIIESTSMEERNVNIAEQLRAFEAKRAAAADRMAAIMEKAGEEGRTLEAAEQEEYDGLASEVKSIDAHLVRLRDLEKTSVQKATRVTVEAGQSAEGAMQVRSGASIVQVERKLDKGIEFARYAMALGAAKGNIHQAFEIAKSRFADSPRVVNTLKAAVAAGTTTDADWAADLVEYNQFAGDFVEYLRPRTIIGRFGQGGVPSLRAVPFNVNIRAQTSGGSGYWVGQGAPKPLTKFNFDNIYLGWAKVANIAVLTEELLRFSNPSAEALVRDSLAGALIERLDTDFVDPTKAAVANVSPASITNAATPIPASGTGTADDIRADVKAAMTAFIAANITPTAGVWIMPTTVALALSLMRNPLGQKEFPDVSMLGGTFEGLPVITSEYVPSVSAGATVILANASDIWLADDGQVVIDASREASLQMLDNPTNDASSGTPTTMVSMFQTNSVAMRAERWINWKLRRAAAVQVISNVNWGA
jgi:HK97 family phage major capsid protein/HK97 family phage prohead protease